MPTEWNNRHISEDRLTEKISCLTYRRKKGADTSSSIPAGTCRLIEEESMRKAGLLLASVVFLAFAAPVWAQTPADQPGGKVSYPNPVNSLLFSSEGAWKFEARVKGGVEHLNMNFDVNLPFSGIQPIELFAPPCPLNFRLNDANLWMGRLETEMTHEKWGIFLNGEAAIPANVGAVTPAEPFWAGQFPVGWQGSDLLWGSIETGVAYHYRPCVSLLLGFRWSPFSENFRNPGDPTGLIQNFRSFYGDVYTSNMRDDLYIPYIGARVEPFPNKRLKLTVLYSPIAFADVSQQYSYTFLNIPHSYLQVGQELERYSMSNFGNFVECGLEYEVPLCRGISLGLWVKGNYIKVSGNANDTYAASATVAGTTVFTYSGVAQGPATLQESTISGGATFSF
jgi:hypothetical protein